MPPHFFKNETAFRKWLEKNHTSKTELLVGFYKKDSGKANMTWSQSVDEALCFGWIDGVRRSIDEVSYCIRFTPRKPSSIWSNINIAKVADLTKKDLMQPAGFEAFSKRKADKYEMYSFENDAKEFTPEFVKRFQSNPAAWDFFMKQAPASFRKTVIHWIVTAKQEKTRLTRLEKMIAECEQGIRGWEKYKK